MALSRGSKAFLFVLVLVLGGIGGVLWWANQQLSGTPGDGEPVTVEVPRGGSFSGVGEELVAEGVIRNATAFAVMGRVRTVDLQAGSHEFRTGMSVDEALAVLDTGPAQAPQVRFTVREGLTVGQTLDELAEQFDDYDADDFRAALDQRSQAGGNEDGVLEVPDWVPEPGERPERVREPYEGLLWPQTFDISEDAAPVDILQKLVDQLDTEMSAISQAQVDESADRGLDRYQTLTLASLVEEETRVAEERGQVAGVMINRLEDERALQIDATVLYALDEEGQDQVLLEDLEVSSPYNTYQNVGLPPTPISGLGTASLRAAFTPDEVPFVFYVLDPSCNGTHRFAETKEEHDRNVAEFREAGRCLEEE